MPEVKKHIVKVGKSEVHLFPVEHTMDDYQKRRWIGIKPVLKSISPDFDAIALEGKTDEGFREELGRALYSKKKFREPEEKLIRKKVVKDNIKLLVIDAIKTEESVRDRETDKKALFASIQIPTRGKRGKLREDWKVDFSEKEFRDVMMTSNLLKAIKAMEEQKDAVKVALIAHPAHIVSIERYLKNPKEFKKLESWVKSLTKKYGTSKWGEVAILHPENVDAGPVAKLERALSKAVKK